MKTFSLNNGDEFDSYAASVWRAIQKNERYFKYFNKDKWQEAVHRTYVIALDKRNQQYEDIVPYIKNLARNVLKTKTDAVVGLTTEEGEISPIFSGPDMQSFIDTDNIDSHIEIQDKFKELYLLDKESFMKLKNLFLIDEASELKKMRNLRVRNQKMSNEFMDLVDKYGYGTTFQVLHHFFTKLPQMINDTGHYDIKEIKLKKPNVLLLEKIPSVPTIYDKNGLGYKIDKTNLRMDINPDYIKWSTGETSATVFKVDISEYINYMYEEVFVEEGVNTKHIEWCGDKYKVTTPADVTHIGLDREKFISQVRAELIINLLGNSLGQIVALSPDSIYFKPSRSFSYKTIRVKFISGKIFDLPVSVYQRKKVLH